MNSVKIETNHSPIHSYIDIPLQWSKKNSAI